MSELARMSSTRSCRAWVSGPRRGRILVMEPSRYFVRRTGGGLPVEAPIETEASPIFLDEGRPLVDLPAYWRIVRKHYRLVIAIMAAVITVTMVKVMLQTPMYEAQTTIMIEPS